MNGGEGGWRIEKAWGEAMIQRRGLEDEADALQENDPGLAVLYAAVRGRTATGPTPETALRRFRRRPDQVFDWLRKYADHEPDWADGYLRDAEAKSHPKHLAFS